MPPKVRRRQAISSLPLREHRTMTHELARRTLSIVSSVMISVAARSKESTRCHSLVRWGGDRVPTFITLRSPMSVH